LYRLLEHWYLHFVVVYIHLSGGIASLKNKYVPKKIDWMLFIMYTQCVVCKAGTEFLKVIWINFITQWLNYILFHHYWNMSAIKNDNPRYLVVAQANKLNEKQTELKYITLLKYIFKKCASKPRLFPIFKAKLCFKTCVLTWFIIMLMVVVMLTLTKICICCNNNSKTTTKYSSNNNNNNNSIKFNSVY